MTSSARRSCPAALAPGWFAPRCARPTALAVGLLLAFGVLGAAAPPTKADADTMLRKIALITVHGLAQKPSARSTTISESELNSFLAIHARKDIPAGVVDPVVLIDADGRLTGRAIVDLDEVRQSRKPTGFSLLSLVSGRVPVEAVGTLTTGDGRGQFALESASAAGIPIPKALLQEVVSYYSKTVENPAGIDIDAPFALPVHIREVKTQKGRAIVVQ